MSDSQNTYWTNLFRLSINVFVEGGSRRRTRLGLWSGRGFESPWSPCYLRLGTDAYLETSGREVKKSDKTVSKYLKDLMKGVNRRLCSVRGPKGT